MATRVLLRGEEAEITIELGDGPVPDGIRARLPFESKARFQGEQLLLPIPVSRAAEAADVGGVEPGEVHYRPEGNLLSLFFGTSEKTDAGEDLTKVGEIVEGLESCKLIRANEAIRLEAAE